jgi:predicted ATPase/DNA-binding SARP family transcriptional activator
VTFHAPATNPGSVPGPPSLESGCFSAVAVSRRSLGFVAAVRFGVLGALDVRRDNAPVAIGSSKQRLLLSALLVHLGEVVSVDRLADIVWSGEPPPSAGASLKTYVWRLREVLGPEVIATRPPGYMLELGAHQLDSRDFERLLRDGAVDDALALWRGRPFAEFADEDWARPSVLRLEEMYAAARESHVETLLAAGRVDDAVASAEALCDAAPFRERARGLLMQGLARQGRATEALRAYDTFRRFLADETGLEPSSALGEIQRAVLAQEQPLAQTGRASTPPTQDGIVELPSGTVTFLFTDVEGSTRLWAADPTLMSASLLVHDQILREVIESRSGYVFTTGGDSFAAAFARASDAVRAATEAQRSLGAADWPGPALQVRMGLHLGEAEERGGDYFGPVVNTTARIGSAGHGGQVVLSEAVRTTAAVATRDLGVHRLRDVADPMQLWQLGDGDFPALRVVDPALSNLPVRPTRLIGRDDEIAKVRRLLEANRLVTITAVGGSGKTRVAIAAGEAELPHRSGGVWFVDLTAVMDGADVPAAIANSLGLSVDGRDPTDQVLGYLSNREALVILDNCEHLIDECATFAERFLSVNGQTTLLATSRESLNVDGERAIVLGSLASDTAESPGVRLFAERAVAADATFALTNDNIAALALLCTRLDGMPLAIELAAARVTVMTPAELLAGLNDRFQLLSGGRRRHRQRTMEATLDWSYDLLDPDEQRVFRSLGVFVDGFDLDAVVAVTDMPRPKVTDLIAALVAKSLIVRVGRGDVARFALLETVKAYAEDRLVQAGDAALVRDRHLAHFHALANRYGRTILPELRLGQRLRHDTSNVTSAFEWATSADQWTIGTELLLGSTSAFGLDGRVLEGRALLERSITRLDADDRDLADYARSALTDLQGMLWDWDAVGRAAAAMVTSGDRHIVAHGEIWLGLLKGSFSRPEGGRRHFDSAQVELDRLQLEAPGVNTDIVTQMLPCQRAETTLLRGDPANALSGLQRSIAQADVADFLTVKVMWLGVPMAAYCQTRIGEPEKALQTLSRLDPFHLPFDAGTVRALVHLALGDFDHARQLIRSHAARGASGRFAQEAGDSVLLLAALADAEGDRQTAADLLLNTGIPGTTPAIVHADFLAEGLNIAAELATHKRKVWDPTGVSEHGTWGVKLSMNTLRCELTRRGWS